MKKAFENEVMRYWDVNIFIYWWTCPVQIESILACSIVTYAIHLYFIQWAFDMVEEEEKKHSFRKTDTWGRNGKGISFFRERKSQTNAK